MQYSVRFIHKISPDIRDVMSAPVEIPEESLANSKMLGKVLRDKQVLYHGERISTFRVEVDKIVVFPCNSFWHSIILTAAY